MSPILAARCCALGLALAAGLAAAQQGAGSLAEGLRPSGPVTVTADRAEWEQDGAMVYTGTVALTSDTLQLSGERLELRQHDNGEFEATITGSPARLSHPGMRNRRGEQGPPVSAQARTLHYDSRSSVVDIQGQARLTRGQDEVQGEQIRYDVAQRRIRAAGGEGGQVRIVIQPPAGTRAGGSSPAPAATPPARPAAPAAPAVQTP